MILTGKAKKSFFDHHYKGVKWTHEDVEHFDQEIEFIQHAYIINWFDSVGIIINILNLDLQKRFYYKIVRTEITEGFFLHSERQEATKQAIIKANQIYNELPR